MIAYLRHVKEKIKIIYYIQKNGCLPDIRIYDCKI